jgi:dihydroorotase-like cyclic amidohydrolase
MVVHVAHLSSSVGLSAAREALRFGARMVLETCPQYLWVTDADYERLGNVLRMNPPVRTAADRAALRHGLLQGMIQRVATDHAPHTDREKLNASLDEASPGSPGVQTLLLSCLELARHEGHAAEALRWICENPARQLGIYPRKGAIAAGSDGDLVLVDPEAQTIVRAAEMHSRQRHGVLEGLSFPFAVREVYSRGELVARDGRPVAAPGRARLVRLAGKPGSA